MPHPGSVPIPDYLERPTEEMGETEHLWGPGLVVRALVNNRPGEVRQPVQRHTAGAGWTGNRAGSKSRFLTQPILPLVRS